MYFSRFFLKLDRYREIFGFADTNNSGSKNPDSEAIQAAPDNTMLLYGILVAVIIAILIGLAALIAVFRKK